MDIQFVKMNPTQNMTILVESPVPRERHIRVAAALMDYGSVYAEQVGFIEAPSSAEAWSRLQMMGGEFCGNATMSLAAYLLWRRGVTGGKVTVPLEVSGVEGILACDVEILENRYRATVDLPPPRSVGLQALDLDGRAYDVGIVYLDGIVHAVTPTEGIPGDPKAFALRALEAWAPYLKDDARGIALFDEGAMRMDPLVQVQSAGSLVWERGCGSGSAAVGAYLASRAERSLRVEVTQPGGVIAVEAEYADGAVKRIRITGEVRVAARGVAFVDDKGL